MYSSLIISGTGTGTGSGMSNMNPSAREFVPPGSISGSGVGTLNLAAAEFVPGVTEYHSSPGGADTPSMIPIVGDLDPQAAVNLVEDMNWDASALNAGSNGSGALVPATLLSASTEALNAEVKKISLNDMVVGSRPRLRTESTKGRKFSDAKSE